MECEKRMKIGGRVGKVREGGSEAVEKVRGVSSLGAN